jgi:hypothetical protein
MDGATQQPIDDALLRRIVTQRLELHLARGRGDDRAQVADARRCGRLAQLQGTPGGVGEQRLQVRDADPHADAERW